MISYKNNLIKVGDIVLVTYYAPYFVKGKERLIARRFKGVCVSVKALAGGSESIKLKAWYKGTTLDLKFNLRSPLIIKIELLGLVKSVSTLNIKNIL